MTPQAAPAAGASLCARCDAVCCRLTVVLQPEDRIPAHYTTHTAAGLHVMARDEMSGPYCRELRADYRDRNARGIPLVLY